MNCSEADRCGLIKWLESIKKEPDCHKNTDDCGRLDPVHTVEVPTFGPQTHEELQMAAEIFGMKKSS